MTTRAVWSGLITDPELPLFTSMSGLLMSSLSLTANLVQLISLSPNGLEESTVSVVTVLAHLLSACSQYVMAKQCNLYHWHPVLDWFSVSLDKHLQASMGQVKAQLARLWSPDCVRLMTSHLSLEAASLPAIPSPPSPQIYHRWSILSNDGHKIILWKTAQNMIF